MKTSTKSGGSRKDKQAGTDCQGSTDWSCLRSRHYVVISDEFRLTDFFKIPSLDLEGLVVLAWIKVYEILLLVWSLRDLELCVKEQIAREALFLFDNMQAFW